MRLFSLILLILIINIPLSSAQLGGIPQTDVSVTDQNLHTIQSQSVQNSLYYFSFPQPPWNMSSENHTANNSLVGMNLIIHSAPSEKVDQETSWNVTMVYNGSHSFALEKRISKASTFFFGATFWVRDLSFYVDGVEKCHDTYHYFASILGSFFHSPTSGTDVNFRYLLTADFLSSTENFSIFGTQVKLAEAVNDAYPYKCTQSGISGGGATNAYGADWNVSDLQSPFAIYVNTTDTHLQTVTISYQAESNEKRLTLLQEAFENSSFSLDCLGFLNFLLNCLNPFDIIISTLGFIGDISKYLLTGLGPIGESLASLISIPLTLSVDTFNLFTAIFLNSQSSHGVSGGFWFLLLTTSTYGWLYDTVRGFKGYFLIFPFFFFYWSLFAIIYAAYFFFWIIPKTAFEIASYLFNAVTNLIP